MPKTDESSPAVRPRAGGEPTPPEPSSGSVPDPELRRLEEQKRQAEIERALARVQAWVQAMRSSADLVPIIPRMAHELRALGLEFLSLSIGLIDREAERVQLYLSAVRIPQIDVSRYAGATPFESDTARHLDRQVGPRVITDIPGADDDLVMYVAAPLESYHGRLHGLDGTTILHRSEAEVDAIVPEWEARWGIAPWPDELKVRSAVRCPFEGGTIALSDGRPDHFGPDEAQVLERFAGALALGYKRYLDFRRLEEQNRELEIARAVASVQSAVQGMTSSADIVRVITLLSNELEALGVEFMHCAINFEETRKIRSFGTHSPSHEVVGPEEIPELVFGTEDMRRLDRQRGPFWISGIPEATSRVVLCLTMPSSDYLERQPHIRETTIVSRSEDELTTMARSFEKSWGISPWPEVLRFRSSVRAPFGGGVIAVNHTRRDAFTEADADIMTRFAHAFSLGYARYLDFRRVEEQNRELEVARAVASIQSAVQGMTSSADIVRVITLLSNELEALGIGFTASAISFEGAERVRSFSTLPLQTLPRPVRGAELQFGTADMPRLDREPGPFWISGIPEATSRIVLCLTMPSSDYFERQPHIQETTIVSRSEDELATMARSYEKTWGLSPWPERYYFRSSVRAPFEGGVIAVSDTRRDVYTQADADIMTRFAEAFSLGYARYLDFRRLEEQNRELEAANRLKSEFLANMSHEIRTPMNAVINFSSLILDGTYGDVSPDLRDAVEEIDRNGSSLLVLINDILDLARIEAGAMTLQLEACRPEECVDGAIAALEYDAREKGLEVERVVEAGLPTLECDGRRVTQHVLVNLLKNAIKFTPEGRIEVGAARDDGMVRFHVADTGVGIPEGERENIFESFRQVDGSLTREAEGTGLGLTIARKFVELHGGRIWVESEVGRGSTFHFTLPVSGG